MTLADATGADLQIAPADPFGAAARQLVSEMVAEIPQRYAEALDAAALAQRAESVLAANDAFTGERSVFLTAIIGDRVVGCGALQPLVIEMGEEIGEIKRMYVTKAARRRGVGAAILAALEVQAQSFGYHRLRLETGNLQPEAAALYSFSGWVRIEPFGAYAGDSISVCFEKVL